MAIRRAAIATLIVAAAPPASAGVNLWTGNGPANQDFHYIAVAPTSPATIFASYGHDFPGNGLLRSTDAGVTWTLADSGAPNFAYFGVTVSPFSPSRIFLDAYYLPYLSTDSGSTWSEVTGVGVPSNVYSIAFEGSTGIAGGYGGIATSMDGGGSWSPASLSWNGFDLPVYAVGLDGVNPANMYAMGNGAKFYRSTDGGAVWTKLNTGPYRGYPIYPAGIAVDRLSSSTLYAFHEAKSMARSTDSGSSWTFQWGTGLSGSRRVALSRPGSTLIGGSAGVFRSTDGGTWMPVPGTEGFSVSELAADPADPEGFYATSNTGLLHESNGNVTQILPASDVAAEGWAVAGSTSSLQTAYLGTPSGVFKTTDDGATWAEKRAGIGARWVRSLFTLPDSQDTVLAGTDVIAAFRSTDAGETWASLAVYDPDLSVFAGPVDQFFADPLSADGLYAVAGALLRSSDRGSTWKYVYYAEAAAVDASGHTLYTADTAEDAFNRSTDAGATFSSSYLPAALSHVTRIAVDPTSPSTVYLGGWEGLFKSTDAGDHWLEITPPTSNKYVDGIEVDPRNPALVIVATDGGAFRSANGGASWSDFNAGISGIVQSLARSPLDPDKLFCGTIGPGGGHAITLVFSSGDVNGSGAVDVLDVFALIKRLFASGAAPIGSGDVNGDGHVDVMDVFALIGYLFAGGPAPV